MNDGHEPPRIHGYSFGSIRIDDETYTSDVIIYPDRITDWWRKTGHYLQEEDVIPILEHDPDVLVIGTGHNGVLAVAQEVENLCSERGVTLIARPTPEAWQIYNNFASAKDRTVVAALHLTC